MINIELPKQVKGDRLAEKVELAMNELGGFEIKKESKHQYDSNAKSIEVSRLLKARKKYRWKDPFIPDNWGDDTIGNWFSAEVSLGYLIPIFGWAAYVAELTDPEGGTCLIETEIELNKDYKHLSFMASRKGFRDIEYNHPLYKYIKDDIEQFVSNLNQKLRI